VTLGLICLAAYLVGAIPVGVLIARSKGVDILSFGSGNPGATNVKRALGTKFGVLVFLLDVSKGLLPGLATRYLVTESLWGVDAQVWAMIVGMCSVMGHCLSPFLGFRGGKGIATSLGAALAAAPIPALLAFGVWFVVLGVWNYVSLASVIAIPTTLIWGAVLPGESRQMLVIYCLLSVFILATHRANLVRLRAGTESKFVWKDKDKQSESAVGS
jgi:glycerol-3-phosphate acyltransferase PlsY